MLVHLIRHAHAVDAAEDPARPLSRRGLGQIRALARFLEKADAFKPAEIWHSPLQRSHQTATQLARHLGLAAPLREVPGLEPDDDPRVLARRLKKSGQDLALVGHEPQLSALASLLVAGKAAPAVFVMKKSAILALEGAGPHWMVRWHWSPDLVA